MEKLKALRTLTKTPAAAGLSDEDLTVFLKNDPLLRQAIEQAIEKMKELSGELPELTKKPEQELLNVVSASFLSFYPSETSSPFIPIAAQGPWVVTYGGAVIYDTGGYGMLGAGHNPENILRVMAKPQVMANIMTPSFAQYRIGESLKAHIGQTHQSGTCPYEKFLFMNSGSEGMGVALRISDAHAKRMTDQGGRHAGKEVNILSFLGSFHGRTYRAARISSSTRKKYDESLASFRDHSEHQEIRVNDAAHLREVFAKLEADNIYIEALALEPVMGEGNPGHPLSREFYDAARELTAQHGAFLIIDSIQAGLRTQGSLSIIDYPGFEDCTPPDMEVYSKALNGGQYPLSVLAMQQWAADEYIPGTYGNTMTANPRALDIATEVLRTMTPSLSGNIRAKGREFVEKLQKLQQEMPEAITKVQGTGLLVSAQLGEDIPVIGNDAVEQRLRKAGVNVIHGGTNSVRYTPWFSLSSEEIDLIVRKTRKIILQFT